MPMMIGLLGLREEKGKSTHSWRRALQKLQQRTSSPPHHHRTLADEPEQGEGREDKGTRSLNRNNSREENHETAACPGANEDEALVCALCPATNPPCCAICVGRPGLSTLAGRS